MRISGMAWYVVVAEFPRWPSREEMGRILAAAGFRVDVGPYAVRLLDFEEGFSFETYGGDLGEPVLEAASDSLDRLARFTRRVSEALSRAKVPHGFYICEEEGGETVVSLEGGDMTDSGEAGTRVVTPPKVEKGSVRFTEGEVAEVDDRGHPVLRIRRDRIRSLRLRWGLQAARPAVQLGLGVLLTAAGAVLLVALLVGWAREGGILHLEMVGGFAFLILAGGWLLTTALRKGYYLEVLTVKGIEKVRFDRRVAPEEIVPFLTEAERRLGYAVEDAQILPGPRS